MKKYIQKSPKRVEAMLLTDKNLSEAADWCKGFVYAPRKGTDRHRVVFDVQEGVLDYAFVGEYLVKDGLKFMAQSKEVFNYYYEEDSEA